MVILNAIGWQEYIFHDIGENKPAVILKFVMQEKHWFLSNQNWPGNIKLISIKKKIPSLHFQIYESKYIFICKVCARL